MTLDDLRNDCQTQARTRHRTSFIRPVETVEHPRAVIERDSGSSIPNADRSPVSHDRDRFIRRTELVGIRQEIRQRTLQHRFVPKNHGARRVDQNRPIDAPLPPLDSHTHDVVEVNRSRRDRDVVLAIGCHLDQLVE